MDVGCGVGTWLKYLMGKGADVRGIDGPWVTSLVIPEKQFIRHHFGEGFKLPIVMRFDLAISLEVGEHINPSLADEYVAFLCGLSDVVLFSAAVPGQGGHGHVNERWPDYWAALFAQKGYVQKDVLRSRFWSDERIPGRYRQNLMLYGKPERIGHIEDQTNDLHGMPLANPEILAAYTDVYLSQAWDLMRKSIRKAVSKRLVVITRMRARRFRSA